MLLLSPSTVQYSGSDMSMLPGYAGPSNSVQDANMNQATGYGFISGNSSSMTETLLAPINELQALAQSLFQSVSASQKSPPAPPISAFLFIDASLAAAVKQARVHQVKQRKIERLKDEVLELERRWRTIVLELEQGRHDLEAILGEGEERIKGIEAAKAGEYSGFARDVVKSSSVTLRLASIPYPELLAYAQSISAFTSAPPHMPDLGLPGQPPPPLFFPPFPNEEKMRRGHMGAEEPLGLLGETHEVGKGTLLMHSYLRKTDLVNCVSAPTPPRSVELPLAGANPYRPEHRAPQQLQMFDFDLDLNPDL